MDISDRPVRFEIWIPKSPKITPEVHNELSKNAHACLFVFTRNSQESWDMITTYIDNPSYKRIPGAILAFPSPKENQVITPEQTNKFGSKQELMVADIGVSESNKIAKILTKIGRLLKSEHEREVESKRPDSSEIHKIIRNGDLSLLQFCLYGENDPNTSKPRGINTKDRRGMSPLHVAVSRGDLSIVLFLVKSGCNINIKDKDLNTALHVAAAQGHIKIAQALIDNNISLAAREKSQLTYAGVAAREGNTSFLKKAILDWNADPLEIKDLDLTGRQLKELPTDFPWSKLENLRSIDLSGNNLDVIPADFITLPQLEKVSLEGNPLRSIPERFRNPWPVLRDYLGTVGTKAARWTEKKLLFVGQEGVGKTTLLKTIRSRRHKVSCKENLSTDGIDIHQNVAIDAQSTVSFSAWDFGGQEVYYPSHQFFLSSNSIFLVVFDLSDDDHSRVEYWMKQIMVMNNSPQSPIIIVGTHLDDKQCTPEYVEEKIRSLNNRFPKYRHLGFHSIIPVSCKSGQGIKKLMDTLYAMIENEPFPLLPESWVHFYEYLNSYRKKLDHVSWAVYTSWARRCGVKMEDIGKCTEFLADVGSVIHFNDPHGRLNDLVILNPQFLADLMATLITFRHSWVKEGKLAIADLPQVLVRFDAALAETLLALLVRFNIIHKIKGSTDYMVPSLLPANISTVTLSKTWSTETPSNVNEFRRLYKFMFLPLGFFSRLMLRMLHIPNINGILFWRDGFIVEYFGQKSQILYNPRQYILTIAVRVQKDDNTPGILLRVLVEAVESLIVGFYPRLKDMVERFVPCTHCLKFFKSLREPYNFTYAESIAAMIFGKSYMFCQNISSPSRCVRIEQLAPDIGFTDIPMLNNDDITISSQLGAGGFGIVYKGLYKDTPVAIKELKFLLGNDEERVQKFREFQQEAWIMSFLNHPHIVHMLGCTVNPLRMVLELIPGGDLFHYMHPKVMENGVKVMKSKLQSEFSWDLRFKLAYDIAIGMRYLHHENEPPIIHRDLRSPNIFMVSDNIKDPVCCKVADFGLAAMVMPDIAGALGTWQWLAPEVIDRLGSAYDCRSDVYSFGIVLWEICSIDIPFLEYLPLEEYSCLAWDNTGKEIRQFNPEVMKQAIIEKNLRPTIPSDLPPGVGELIASCIAPDPNDRPFFTAIVDTLCKFIGCEAPPLNIPDPEKGVSSRVEGKIGDYEANIDISECKEIVTFQKRIDFDIKIRCMVISGGHSLIAANGILMRYDSNGNQCKKVSVLKDDKKSELNIHSMAAIEDVVWGGCEDGTIIVWIIESLEEKARWKAHAPHIVKPLAVVHTPTNKTVWSASPVERTVRVWNAKDYRMLAVVQSNEHPVYCLTQHQDFVWMGGSGELFVYNSSTYQLRGNWRAHESSISCILSLGNRVWTGSAAGDIKIWEDKSGSELLFLKELKVHCAKILGLCKYQMHHVWSCALDKSTLIWDAKNFVPIQEIADPKDSVSTVARSGNLMWTNSDKAVSIWKYKPRDIEGLGAARRSTTFMRKESMDNDQPKRSNSFIKSSKGGSWRSSRAFIGTSRGSVPTTEE